MFQGLQEAEFSFADSLSQFKFRRFRQLVSSILTVGLLGMFLATVLSSSFRATRGMLLVCVCVCFHPFCTSEFGGIPVRNDPLGWRVRACRKNRSKLPTTYAVRMVLFRSPCQTKFVGIRRRDVALSRSPNLRGQERIRKRNRLEDGMRERERKEERKTPKNGFNTDGNGVEDETIAQSLDFFSPSMSQVLVDVSSLRYVHFQSTTNV